MYYSEDKMALFLQEYKERNLLVYDVRCPYANCGHQWTLTSAPNRWIHCAKCKGTIELPKPPKYPLKVKSASQWLGVNHKVEELK